jgi:pimeloyl-ACP methyl ester carboxylesterase
MTTSRTYGPLRGDETGRDDGRPPIVLLHGLTFDRTIWNPVIEEMGACDPGRRVIALDLPGHGESSACLPHDLGHVAELVHEALEAARATSPLVVGHSISGALASIYSSTYPAAGVVNVDQPPFVGDFARLVRRLESPLRGAGFEQVWHEVFAASFHTELLPEPARALVLRNSRPEQKLVLSYWQTLLEQPVEEVEAWVDATLTQVGSLGIPYVLIVGSELPGVTAQLLKDRIPQLRVVEWTNTGHFPHLAHPADFARLCAATSAARSSADALHSGR